MVILDVFTKNVKITYKSNFLSKATVVTLIFGILTVVLPFIFAYKSKGFWLKRDVFYEQPQVRFKGEYMFVATTSTAADPLLVCSTVPQYQEKYYSLDTCSLIKVQEIDKNFDNKVEEFNLNLHVNLPAESQLTSIYIIIPLDYKLINCPLQMQAAVFFHTSITVPISEYTVISDVVINQMGPLQCHKNSINTLYNYSVLPTSDENQEMDTIIRQYSNRNISTTMKNIYTRFTPGKKTTFSLQMTLRYPEDMLYYKPGFWQTMKWAWIQYLAIYIIVSWIIMKIKAYIFNKRLVLFYEDNPFKKKQ